MKKLPIGIQSIRDILEEDQLYVDKTRWAKELIENGKHYFMSRPRRFGKSLFLNTLEEIFRGNKELFEGCAIYQTNYEWIKYPVLFFDFSCISSENCEVFKTNFQEYLTEMADSLKIKLEGSSLQLRLKTFIKKLAQKNRVVILVDEYDSPMINNLKNLDVAQGNRDFIKGFFTVLKSLDKYLKFTFVTGVSKFSQVSLFSGPNNLTDITMDSRYAAMMGYTEEELKKFFNPHIKSIVQEKNQLKKSLAEESFLSEIRDWYNGYRFSESPVSVYNPYSTLRFFNAKKAESYWYATGTPSFLIDEIKKHPQSITNVAGMSALKSTLSDISRLDRIHLAALMFQTGYLTIKGYNEQEDSYQLDFPNKEVKQAFFNSLLQDLTEIDPLEISRTSEKVKNDLEKFDLSAFFQTMNIHFAKMPYHLFIRAKEGFYQAVFFTFLEKSGIKTYAEIATNIGRIDLVCEMSHSIVIFELKLDKTADPAFDQAEKKKYKERYLNKKKNILILGVNFSSKSRNIGSWKGVVFSSSGELIKEI